MPVTVDGKRFPPVQFEHAVEFIGIITISINLLQGSAGTIVTERFIKNKLARRFFQLNWLLLILWEVSKIEYFYFDSHPIWHFIYGVIAPLSSFMIVTFQLELLRIFRILGYKLSNQILIAAAIANFVIYCATAGSAYMRLFTIGNTPPLYVQHWYRFGYPIYIAAALVFGNAQLLFLLKYLRQFVKKKGEAMMVDSILSSTVQVMEIKEAEMQGLRRLLYSIVFSICIDFVALTVWLSGWAFGFINDFAGQKIQLIGTDLGAYHLLSLCICYYYTQQLFLAPKGSTKSSQQPKPVQKKLLTDSDAEVSPLAATVMLVRSPTVEE
jgi:hypothetical protein